MKTKRIGVIISVVLNDKWLAGFGFMIAVLVILSEPAFSDTYTWTDKNGMFHIVDDLSKVPPEYRKNDVQETDDSPAPTTSNRTPDDQNQNRAKDIDIPALIKALRDPDPSIRERAALTLGASKAAEAVQPLITATRDPQSSVQQAAISALGMIGDPRGVPPLIDALNNPKESIRHEAINALKKIGQPAVEPLGTALNADGKNYQVKREICMILGDIGDKRAAEPLIKALRTSEVAMQAAYALGRINDDRAISPLVELLQRTEAKWSNGRYAAAAMLAQFGGPQAITGLISVLDDVEIASEARNSLMRIKSADVINALALTICDHKAKPTIQYQAGYALSLKGEAAVDPLISCLKDKNCGGGRLTAAYFLGDLKDRRAIEPLDQVLKEQFEDSNTTTTMHSIASASLNKIKGQNVGTNSDQRRDGGQGFKRAMPRTN